MPRPLSSLLLLLVAPLGVGCAHARLLGGEPHASPDPGLQRVVVIEPFFEQSEWDLVTRTEHATVYNPYNTFGGPTDVTITRQVAEKPLYARIESLAAEHQQVITEVQRLRPSWRVTSTGGLPPLSGPLAVVRTVVGSVETIESNRALKNLACAFGFLIIPLVFTFGPVHEAQRVSGSITRFETDAELARTRLLKYPTQPDFAVDTRGMELLTHRFGLEVEFEEGLFAPEAARDPVLLQGFAARLAAAVVAIVEEGR
jgi:hypothetical protein